MFAVAVAALGVIGRPDPGWGPLRHLATMPRGLTRVTGVPGWAAVAVGLSLFGLLVAGEGFYSDVAWHGRSAATTSCSPPEHPGRAGVHPGRCRPGHGRGHARRGRGLAAVGLRVPRTLAPLWAVGLAAVSGFPLDEAWHQAYGIDVTVWSPTHMLMILGASLTGLAAPVALAGAAVQPPTGAGRGRPPGVRLAHAAGPGGQPGRVLLRRAPVLPAVPRCSSAWRAA